MAPANIRFDTKNFSTDTMGDALRILRKRTNLSQADLSELVQISVTSIRNWESGVNTPTGKNLQKLIDIYFKEKALTAEEAKELWYMAETFEPLDKKWFSDLTEEQLSKKVPFKDFSSAFDYYFSQTKMTMREFAQRLEFNSESAIKAWSQGYNRPSDKNLVKIIRLFLEKRVFEQGSELEQARMLWELADVERPFDAEWFSSVLKPSNLSPEDRVFLRKFLNDKFSFDELKDLAFDLSLDLMNFELGNKYDFVRDLILYYERRQSTQNLLLELLKYRTDSKIAEMAARLVPPDAKKKVQIFLPIESFTVKGRKEILERLAEVLDVDPEEIMILVTNSG